MVPPAGHGSGGGTIGDRRYQETTLGTADDSQDADGLAVLNYGQAQAKAREWFATEQRRAAGLEEVPAGPFCVRDAATGYLAWFADHRKSFDATKSAIEAHVLPELGDVEVAKLTTTRLRQWHADLAKRQARLRTGRGRAQRYRQPASAPDGIRARRATANRLLTVLKAMLNRAFEEGHVSSDLAWRRVKPFRGVDVAIERFLEVDERARICNACEPDFRDLVRGALLSGARYGELCRADVGDYSSAARKLQVRQAKGGKPRWVALDDEAVEFFEALTAGRPAEAPMFPRADGKRWGKSHQRRRLAEASKAARIEPPASYHILRHTWASHRVMNGADLLVVARVLGHADTRMVEKHYGHLRPSYVDEAVRASAPRGRQEPAGKVVRLR